jgi:hypothetical protein
MKRDMDLIRKILLELEKKESITHLGQPFQLMDIPMIR